MSNSNDTSRRVGLLLDRETRLRERIRSELSEWARLVLRPQGFVPARHHRSMMVELEGLAAGRFDRLMLLMPPGSAKSTYTSLLMPAWFMAREPRSAVIAASHTAGLASSFGRGVLRLLMEHDVRLGVEVDATQRAPARFALRSGGSYFASGVRGPLTGRRADLVIVDDPVKSQRDADSLIQRDHLWDWYRTELVTRLKPGGRIVLVMTRWHPDDLGGRLLQSGEEWRVLRLPALAEVGDPLGRVPGEALWPSWEGKRALERKRLLMGERAFASLFQQSPTSGGGRVFETARMPLVDERLAGRRVRAWDLAASADRGDWTVGVLLCLGANERFQVADVVRVQGAPEQVEAVIRKTAESDGREVTIGLPQDPGQAGKMQVAYLTRGLAGFRVVSGRETGAKDVRAGPVASQANVGNMSLLRGGWNRVFLEELQDFPFGTHDDQVDALSRAFGMLALHSEPARQVRLGFGAR